MAAPGVSKDYALLMAALSARWHNADAIDTAVTQAVEVCLNPPHSRTLQDAKFF